MNILRLSTLWLTLVIAVMTLGFVNPSYAGKKCNEDPGHPSCKDDGDPGGITYTAQLQGAFVFGPFDVTVEGQDERLRAAEDAEMIRPNEFTNPDEAATWDEVFSMPDADTGDPCDLFGNPGSVLSFTALKKEKQEKGWRISLPGGVYVLFFGELPTDSSSAAGGALVRVSLQLIGNCEYSGGTDPDCDPFLPEPDENGPGISEIPLIAYQIHAKALKGEPQFEGCHDASDKLSFPSTLVITATAP